MPAAGPVATAFTHPVKPQPAPRQVPEEPGFAGFAGSPSGDQTGAPAMIGVEAGLRVTEPPGVITSPDVGVAAVNSIATGTPDGVCSCAQA